MEVKQVTLLKRSNEQQQKDGVLTAAVVSNCLSNFGNSGTGHYKVYQFLSVAGQSLSDVSVLCNYVHLQNLELAHNKIKDLSCLSHMPYLIILDASHNELSDFFGFQPPKDLQEVNFSYNHIRKMKDLSAYRSLSKLQLDYNSLTEIRGLERCSSLTYLSLAHNKISKISCLDGLPLRHLCLRGNQLESAQGLDTLRSLRLLDLSFNRIRSLSGLQNLHHVCSVNLESNLICEITEAAHIHGLLLLSNLNLQKNPVQEQQDYRLSLIFLLQHLTTLDQEKVTAEEKVSSVNKYDPPMEVVAAKDHMTQLVYQLMQPQVLYDSTLPSVDSPYPMLVLTGPQGCGKRELAHKLCHEFSEYFAYGACHTTREPYLGEEDGIDYYFVSEKEFQNMIHMGKFVQTMQYCGHRYGLSREAIEDVAREGLACCVHMELEGVLSLRNSYFEPRYVLLVPTQVERYVACLRSRGLYTQAQIDMAVGRIQLYAGANRERPGFFDDVVPCDDQAEVYRTLRQLVKDYLGLEEQMEGDQSDRAVPDHASTERETGIYRSPISATTALARERPTSAKSSRPASGTQFGSALEPSDLSSRNYYNKVHAQLRPQKSSTELASIGRREQLIREAVVGKSLGAYSQLFKRSAQTDPPSQGQDPGLSLTKDKQQISDESSSDESPTHPTANSALSVPSSAGALSEAGARDAAPDPGPEPAVESLDISALRHTLEILEGQERPPQTPDTPRPGTGLRSTMATPPSARPGSDNKPILPPIPLGRKTPVPPSPAQSSGSQTRCSSGREEKRLAE